MKIRIDGNEIQKVKEHFKKRTDSEIRQAINNGTELGSEDIKAIQSKHDFECQKTINKFFTLGPKELNRLELSFNLNGWRSGYTKPTIKSKKLKNRARNKIARKSRRDNRK